MEAVSRGRGRVTVAVALAVMSLSLVPASAWAVADVIKSTSANDFDQPTYFSDEGDLVQFQHTGGGSHNVTSTQFSGGVRLFASATISSGTTSVDGTQFLPPGTYPFICTVHSNMAADLVVRDTGSPAPSPGPPNEFSFGKVKKDKRRGTATLTVIVPARGTLELAKTNTVKGAVDPADAPGSATLPVKPTAKTRKKLNSNGVAAVNARVTFTPAGGEPNTVSKKVKLVKR